MYSAKQAGKSRHMIFDPSMHAHATEQLRLHTDLRRAIERDEFEVEYQPIVQMKMLRLLDLRL
jgi:predicted signal transduction protein with EAL and GGDEF domain